MAAGAPDGADGGSDNGGESSTGAEDGDGCDKNGTASAAGGGNGDGGGGGGGGGGDWRSKAWATAGASPGQAGAEPLRETNGKATAEQAETDAR